MRRGLWLFLFAVLSAALRSEGQPIYQGDAAGRSLDASKGGAVREISGDAFGLKEKVLLLEASKATEPHCRCSVILKEPQTQIPVADFRRSSLFFKIHDLELFTGQTFFVWLRNREKVMRRLSITPYAEIDAAERWQEVEIPLFHFLSAADDKIDLVTGVDFIFAGNLPYRDAVAAGIVIGAATRDLLAADGPRNLIDEGSSFETGLDGFAVSYMSFVRDTGNSVQPDADSSTSVHGRCSLRIRNLSGSDSFSVISKAIDLIPGETYTFSTWAKSDTPGLSLCLSIDGGKTSAVERNFPLTAEWQRLHFTAKLPVVEKTVRKIAVAGRYTVRVTAPFMVRPNTIWVDALQLERGELTDYQYPRTADLAIHSDKYLKIWHVGEEAAVRASIYAPQNVAGGQVAYRIMDLYFQDELAHGQIEVASKVDRWEGMLTLPTSRRGCFKLIADYLNDDGKLIDEEEFIYGTIVPGRSWAWEKRDFFGTHVSTFWSLVGDYMRKADPTVHPKHYLRYYNYNSAACYALASDIGFGWVRQFTVFAPQSIAVENGEYAFDDADVVVEQALSQGLKMMPVLGSGSLSDLPAWLQSQEISRRGGIEKRPEEKLPSLDAYKTYIYETIRHFKGRIKHWEAWNEPGVEMEPEDYAPILAASYEAAKGADEDCVLIGLCGTRDRGGDLFGWTKSCMKLGAARCMDAISIHGYHIFRDRSALPDWFWNLGSEGAMSAYYVRETGKTARELSGRDFPIWETERGFAFRPGYRKVRSCLVAETDNAYPHSLQRLPEKIVDYEVSLMASGAVRQFYFNLVPWIVNIRSDCIASLLHHDGAPSTGLAAMNALIDILGGAAFVQEVEIGEHWKCFVFEREGESVLAAWSPRRETRRLRLSLPPDRVELLDVMGNPAAPGTEGGDILLTVDHSPRYLRAKGIDARQLARAIRVEIDNQNQPR